jgi:cadmium resistance protein CadD (predicted permease)
VGQVAAGIGAAVALFVGTNLDDLIVLTLFNASARAAGRPRRWQIWAGQYVGFAVLVVIALLASLGLFLVPTRWIGFLGLVPIGLGVWRLAIAIRDRHASEPDRIPPIRGLTGVAAITVANGGDNLAAYIPAFRAMSAAVLGVTLIVFAIGVAVWCALGALLTAHPAAVAVVQRWGHWVIPVVYIAIGVAIMWKTGLIG